MYGPLSFSNSHFFAQPTVALVTAMGRETLHRGLDIAQENVGLKVIYGDTDSINDPNWLKAMELGEKGKKEASRLL